MTLRIDIRDRRLRGGRLSVTAATKSKVVRRQREAAIRTLLDRGDVEIVEQLRAGRLHIAALERAVREGDYDTLRGYVSTSLTLGVAAGRVLSIVRSTAADNTARNYGQAIKRLLETFGDDRDIASIALDELRQFMHGNGRSWSANTQAGIAMVGGRIWREAIEHERAEAERLNLKPRLMTNPWPLVERAEQRPTRHAFLRPVQWQKLAETVKGTEHHAPLALGCLAGLRIGEVVNLRTHVDVDLSKRRLHVQPRKGEFEWKPKTWRGVRSLRISDQLHEALARHIAEGFAGERYLVRSPYEDRPLSTRTLETWTREAFGAAGIEYGRSGDGITFHGLRHTFASWLVQRDVQMAKVAMLLGDTAAMVERVYGHLLPTDLDRAIDLVDDIAREAS